MRARSADLGLSLVENLSGRLRTFALTMPRERFAAEDKIELDLDDVTAPLGLSLYPY
jgi:hypothetical protein